MSYTQEVEARLRAESAEIIGRYPTGHARSALLPMLHLVQSEDGYVSPDGIALIADILGLSRPEVSAVATFYTQYKRHPNGDYLVGVCTNALCAVMGGDAIWDAVSEHVGVGSDETNESGRITLERIECNAACDYARKMAGPSRLLLLAPKVSREANRHDSICSSWAPHTDRDERLG